VRTPRPPMVGNPAGFARRSVSWLPPTRETFQTICHEVLRDRTVMVAAGEKESEWIKKSHRECRP